MTKQYFDQKYENEKYFLGIDFTNKLSSGETISTGGISVTLNDVDVTSSVIDSTQTTISSPYVYFWLKAATLADLDYYKIIVSATTDQGSTYIAVAYLKIVE